MVKVVFDQDVDGVSSKKKMYINDNFDHKNIKPFIFH